jgi:hypothetical protein
MMRILSRSVMELKAAWIDVRHELYHFSRSRLRMMTFASG